MQALAAGVVPRSGLRHIQVGRSPRWRRFCRHRAHPERRGGGPVRHRRIRRRQDLLPQPVRLIALEKKLVTVPCGPGPGQAPSRPRRAGARTLRRGGQEHGDAHQAGRRGAGQHHGALFDGRVREAETAGASVEKVIDAKLAPLQDEVGGYDYTVVLKAYLRGSEKGDEDLKTGALRWIRGEFTTKTEARSILPCATSSTTPTSTTP